MPANTTPIYPLAPRCAASTLVSTTALTARTIVTGVTGLTLVSAMGANGTRVDQIIVKGSGTTVAGQLDFWIYNGTSSWLFKSVPVTVVTATTTLDSFEATLSFSNLILPSTHSIYFSSQVAAQLCHAILLGGDY